MHQFIRLQDFFDRSICDHHCLLNILQNKTRHFRLECGSDLKGCVGSGSSLLSCKEDI